MRYLILPLFILRLLISTLPSLARLILIKLAPFKSLIVSLFIFIIIILVFILAQPLSPTPKPINTQENLLKQKNQLQSWLEKQPQHRDILFNLAKINQKLDNEDQAQKLLQQAQSLDPNHKIFQEN